MVVQLHGWKIGHIRTIDSRSGWFVAGASSIACLFVFFVMCFVSLFVCVCTYYALVSRAGGTGSIRNLILETNVHNTRNQISRQTQVCTVYMYIGKKIWKTNLDSIRNHILEDEFAQYMHSESDLDDEFAQQTTSTRAIYDPSTSSVLEVLIYQVCGLGRYAWRQARKPHHTQWTHTSSARTPSMLSG